jgi:undecaprenyl-diphosphatase
MPMNIFDAFLLGIIEGITEFLPVSSTGHMILVSHILNISTDSFTKSFEIIIQLGAILAVVFMYRQKVFKNFRLMFKVAIAFVPTAIIGLMLYSFVKKYLLGNIYVVVASLFIGGIIIIAFEKKYGKNDQLSQKESEKVDVVGVSEIQSKLDEKSVTVKQALYIGLFQSIAIIPGVSRSAATIIGGQLLGLSRTVIVEFSFLLAIPVILAAASLDLYKHHESFSSEQFGLLLVGFSTAFFVALIAIKTFLGYIQKHSFFVFGIYRIVLAIIFFFVMYFI